MKKAIEDLSDETPLAPMRRSGESLHQSKQRSRRRAKMKANRSGERTSFGGIHQRRSRGSRR